MGGGLLFDRLSMPQERVDVGPVERMYELLKRLVPRAFLLRHESALRAILYLPFRGNSFECNICDSRLSRFQKSKSDLMCPRCGSLMRARRLFSIVDDGFIKPGISVLDFSPSRCLYRRLKSDGSIHYLASDLAGEFVADVQFDLTHMTTEDDTFDLILCFHVLEHIENDRQAIAELFRVVKPGGACIIQTPFKEGEIFEDKAIISPEARRVQFGQEDHVRVYSVNGLADRLANSGFSVDVREFDERPGNRFGFAPQEVVLIASKPGTQ
jgi:SAM-dependent methyltransferase